MRSLPEIIAANRKAADAGIETAAVNPVGVDGTKIIATTDPVELGREEPKPAE
jgi:hypothetical protein